MTAVTITNAGHNLLRSAINGDTSDVKINYVAVGTGTQGTPATATQLASESFRKAITQYANGGSTGEGVITGYIAPGEGNVAITEVGWFVGGTATANSGTMVMYASYSQDHTAQTSSISLALDSTI